MMIRTIAVGIALTALLAWLDFLAAFFIYGWAGGDFGGYGASARSPADWALPAWVILTVAFVAFDVFVIRSCVKRSRTSDAAER